MKIMSPLTRPLVQNVYFFALIMRVGGDKCSKCFLLCFTEEIKSCRFGRTWRWVNNDWIFHFWVNCVFKSGCSVYLMWRSLMGYNERLWDKGDYRVIPHHQTAKNRIFTSKWRLNFKLFYSKYKASRNFWHWDSSRTQIMWLKWVMWQKALAWAYVCVCVCVCVSLCIYFYF